jgi:predicted alpha/beta superfamily hydrolase
MRLRKVPGNWLMLIALVASSVFAQRASAQEEETPVLTLGRVVTVYSHVLGEERVLLVHLPIEYNFTQSQFPVLYLLDGLANFQHAAATVDFLARNGRIPQMIVVGITNSARTRDFTPTRVEDRDTSGGGDEFLRFVEKELIPYVDERFRTQPFRVLFGHSLGGMFSIYTFLVKPDLFGGYVAASPSIDYDNGHVIDLAEEALCKGAEFKKSLFITRGNEPEYVEPLDRFTGLLERNKISGLRWEYRVLEDEDQVSTPLLSLYQGLKMIFMPWRYPGDLADADVSSLEAHYRQLSEEYGYEILIPEALLNQLGYLLISREAFDDAVAAFELNINNYPGSANVYDSLGECYEAMNKLSLARMNYEKAYERGQEIGDPNTVIYKRHLDDLLQKLQEFD